MEAFEYWIITILTAVAIFLVAAEIGGKIYEHRQYKKESLKEENIHLKEMTYPQLLIESTLLAVERYIYASPEEVSRDDLRRKMMEEINQARRDIHGRQS